MAAMKASEALRQALREVANPVCRRCRGTGVTGRDLMKDLCRCVPDRVPQAHETTESPAVNPEKPSDEEMPHPWGFLTRRAEEIQATTQFGTAPLKWR